MGKARQSPEARFGNFLYSVGWGMYQLSFLSPSECLRGQLKGKSHFGSWPVRGPLF